MSIKQQIKFYTEMTAFNKINYNKAFDHYVKLLSLYSRQIDKQILDYKQEEQLHTLLNTQRQILLNMQRNM